jgi:hypothetical protein
VAGRSAFAERSSCFSPSIARLSPNSPAFVQARSQPGLRTPHSVYI